MRRTRFARIVALVFALALVAAACGQKEGVHVAAGGQVEGGDGTFVTEPIDPGATVTTLPGDTGTEGGEQTVTRTQQGGGQTATGGQTGGGQAQGGTTPRGSDRTGVGDNSLTLAVHAPVTGAAPLPTTSFEKFRDLYWRHITEVKGEKVLGKSKVNVLFRDDKYNPSSARQVCRELADQAFLLVGGGGTDQIQACADFSNSSSVPYLSAGVTERGLTELPWYFATSMSYKAQGELLAQFLNSHPDTTGKKTAMIVTNTPNFDDAIQGWEAAVQKHSINYYKTLKHSKGDSSWYNSFGNELRQNGVEIVYVLTAPVDYIQFAQQNASGDGPGFQYVGVGVTEGLNAILPTGCPEVDRGMFFSPFPGIDWAKQNHPEIFDSAQKLGLGEPDDLALALWGLAEAQHQMFQRYEATFGSDLTREDFRALLETQTGLAGAQTNSIGPRLDYAPNDHFGANQVHVLRADCSIEQHKTLGVFKSGF